MSGHNDTVTGLSVSPNGHYVLSNSMDDTGMPINRSIMLRVLKWRQVFVCRIILLLCYLTCKNVIRYDQKWLSFA